MQSEKDYTRVQKFVSLSAVRRRKDAASSERVSRNARCFEISQRYPRSGLTTPRTLNVDSAC